MVTWGWKRIAINAVAWLFLLVWCQGRLEFLHPGWSATSVSFVQQYISLLVHDGMTWVITGGLILVCSFFRLLACRERSRRTRAARCYEARVPRAPFDSIEEQRYRRFWADYLKTPR